MRSPLSFLLSPGTLSLLATAAAYAGAIRLGWRFPKADAARKKDAEGQAAYRALCWKIAAHYVLALLPIPLVVLLSARPATLDWAMQLLGWTWMRMMMRGWVIYVIVWVVMSLFRPRKKKAEQPAAESSEPSEPPERT